VSDPDAGGLAARSPYARPEPGPPTEPRGAVVESPPDVAEPVVEAANDSTTDATDSAVTDSAVTAGEPGPATVLTPPVVPMSAPTGPTGWTGAATGSSPGRAAQSGVMVGSGLVVPAEGSLATRPRPVQVGVARRGPRRARLVIKHIDPWTVLKISFVVSIVMLAVIVVAVAVIYSVLGRMGVWTQINTLVNEVSPTTTSSALHNPVSSSRVVGVAAVIGAINVVLLTALSTLGAAIYNLISDLVGGVEVTLTDP
jgi:hypothetical protein